MTSSGPNPYAAPLPVSDLVPTPLPYAGSILRQGWKVFAGHWGMLVIVMAIVWLPVATVTSFLSHKVIDETSLLRLLLLPIEFITESLTTGAVIAVAIAAAHGRQPSVDGALANITASVGEIRLDVLPVHDPDPGWDDCLCPARTFSDRASVALR